MSNKSDEIGPLPNLGSLEIELLALPFEERGQAIASACGGKPDLIAQVSQELGLSQRFDFADDAERVIFHHLKRHLADTSSAFLKRLKPLRQLQPGVQGLVFVAHDTYLDRLVVLKFPGSVLLTDAERRRLSEEPLILAKNRHPSVAEIYDAGEIELDDRREAYLAMEHVGTGTAESFESAQSVVDYARGLPFADRLLLGRTACDAIADAHRRGVVHGDLHAGNILAFYDKTHQLRIVDFGKADYARYRQVENPRLRHWPPSDRVAISAEPTYSSDVYALGVLLHELVGDAETHRSGDNPRPIGPATQQMELDCIVAACTTRLGKPLYPTAKELLEDLDRCIKRTESVLAVEPSRHGFTKYHARKYLHRNRWPVSIALASTVFSVVAAIGWHRASQQTHIAETRLTEFESTFRFLANDFFARATPENIPDKSARDTIVANLFEPAAANVPKQFSSTPYVRAKVQGLFADTLHALGHDTRAMEMARESFEILQSAPERSDADFREREVARLNYAMLRSEVTGGWQDGLPLARGAAQELEERFGVNDASVFDAKLSLILALSRLSQHQAALALAEKTYCDAIAAFGNEHDVAKRARYRLISTSIFAGKVAYALSKLGETPEQLISTHHSPVDQADWHSLRAHALARANNWTESEKEYRRAYEICVATLGENHPQSLLQYNNLVSTRLSSGQRVTQGILLDMQEKADRAVNALGPNQGAVFALRANTLLAKGMVAPASQQDELESQWNALILDLNRVYGPEHEHTLDAKFNFASFHLQTGMLETAEAELRTLLPQSQRSRGFSHESTTRVMNLLLSVVAARNPGDPTAALAAGSDILESVRLACGDSSVEYAIQIVHFGDRCKNAGRHHDAELHYRNALSKLSGTPLELAFAENRLACLLADTHRLTEAIPLFDSAVRTRTDILGPSHPDTIETRFNFAGVLFLQKQFAAAETIARETIPSLQAYLGKAHPTSIDRYHDYACMLSGMRRDAEAVKLFDFVIQATKSESLRRRARGSLAATYSRAGDYAQAISLMITNVEETEKLFGTNHPESVSVRSDLGTVLLTAGRPQEAEGHLAIALDRALTICPPDSPSPLDISLLLHSSLSRQWKFDQALAALNRISPRLGQLGPFAEDSVRLTRLSSLLGAGLPSEAAAELDLLSRSAPTSRPAKYPWQATYLELMRCYADGLAGRHAQIEQQFLTAAQQFLNRKVKHAPTFLVSDLDVTTYIVRFYETWLAAEERNEHAATSLARWRDRLGNATSGLDRPTSQPARNDEITRFVNSILSD